jgi:hypothetical protein
MQQHNEQCSCHFALANMDAHLLTFCTYFGLPTPLSLPRSGSIYLDTTTLLPRHIDISIAPPVQQQAAHWVVTRMAPLVILYAGYEMQGAMRALDCELRATLRH